MNVGDLKKMLEEFPDDMELAVYYRSDYEVFDGDLTVITAVPQAWGIMRTHPTMSEDLKANQKEYLLIG